jgi:superfamily II DNA/RNA helicase
MASQQGPDSLSFAALGLDPRVARAAAKRFALPTPVQARAIPLALAGKARAASPPSSALLAHCHLL